MKNLSDEELVRKYIISHINCFVKNLPARHQWFKEGDSLKSELISRLARGQKAIESIKKISKEYNSFLIFNPSSEYELLKSRRDFFWKLEKITTDFQQSCKEAADGN